MYPEKKVIESLNVWGGNKEVTVVSRLL